jgi:hypothetical protein
MGKYEGKSHVEDLGKDGIVMLKCFKKGCEGVDWVNLTENTEKSLIVAKRRML